MMRSIAVGLLCCLLMACTPDEEKEAATSIGHPPHADSPGGPLVIDPDTQALLEDLAGPDDRNVCKVMRYLPECRHMRPEFTLTPLTIPTR